MVSAAPHCGLVSPSVSAAVAQPTAINQATTTNQTAGTSTNGTLGEDVVATGWYAGWYGDKLPPSQISWSKYNSLTFAFATTTPDPSVLALDDQSAALLPTFVTEAHNNNVKALLSVGGWGGSLYYSTAVGNAQNRTAFVKAIVGLANQYNLDGIDFDWEYPGKQGIGCNAISPSDSANFLSFLQELRQDPVGAKLSLTAAVGITPFAGSDGNPMTDVSAFASQLDHIAIMNYDIYGSFSSTVGPNAPLDDTCATVKSGSATSAIKAWTSAGFPASKIALGVAAYGHSFFVDKANAFDSTNTTELALFPAFDKEKQPLGDSDVPGAPPSTDQCGNPVGVAGTFDFVGMITNGFLDVNGNAAPGIDYRFDECSQTPFVYNPTNQTMISYDDAKSFAAKGQFINDNNLAGFAVWHIAADSNNILLDSIIDAMGLEEDCD
ncbi:glycoside hydrolase family 18 protein [Agrocybe pediades]|nr:glycoside hydrolase family 18 protein [Agrocybe pediades]